MGMTIDDNVDFLNEAKDFFEDVANDPEIKETIKTYCIIESLETAIDTMRKYQQLQADYENRLKADLEAILVELQLEIEETAKDAHTNAFMNGYKDMYLNGISASAIKCSEIIQQKINSLKEAKDGENNY